MAWHLLTLFVHCICYRGHVVCRHMNNEINQGVNYIKDELKKGASYEDTRQSLLQSGWSESAIDQAFQLSTQGQDDLASKATTLESSNMQKPKKSIIGAIIWIVSPFIGMFFVLLLAVVNRVMLQNVQAPTALNSLLGLLTVVIGVLSGILIVAGPIVGIIKLSKNK